jgi:NAD(P)-dependent dehydrogenase (short-subunit alcohol dehydrogenase family)
MAIDSANNLGATAAQGQEQVSFEKTSSPLGDPARDYADLTGRVALITGASSHGIGNESAKVLAAHGAKVFLTARREDKLIQAAEEIRTFGGEAAYKATDVSKEQDCEAAVQACVEQFGRLDIMVLSAGIAGTSGTEGPDQWFDTENWRRVLGINLDGIFFMVKHGWKECAKGGHGAITLVGSLASWTSEGALPYSASKGAVRSLVQWFGNHLGRMGVRVNGVYPGLIDTDMTHPATLYAPFAEPQIAKTPLGRFGVPEDIAQAVLFLSSDASSWMTGQHLIVDGGELA